jgi:hypothetical protein
MHIFLFSFWFTYISKDYFLFNELFQHNWLSNLIILDRRLIEEEIIAKLFFSKLVL